MRACVGAIAIACTPVAGPESLIPPSLWNVEVKIALYTVVAAALVAPVAFQPEGPTLVSRMLGNRTMSFLGRISYSLYLIHCTILASLTCWLVLRLEPLTGYLPAIGIAFAVTMPVTLVAAHIFTLLID